jgi:hypothetical protein
MLDVTELMTMRDRLQRNMFAGVQELQLPDRTVKFTSIADMATAIGGINAEIAKQSTGTPSTFTLATHSRE